jgi:hypothetical protein
MATFRVALSVYTRSPAAYNAFKNWNIFNLPSRSAMQKYSTTLLHESGAYFDYIEDQRKKYDMYVKECEEKGWKKLLSEGALILDEVKVIGKVAWNSKNGKLCGLAMDDKQMPFLADLSDSLQEQSKPAEYFLQFLWRDLTSDFDIIGPHYSSASTMDAQFTQACLQDALYAFQQYGFKVPTIQPL